MKLVPNFLFLILLAGSVPSPAQPARYEAYTSGSVLQDKNFYLFTLWQRMPEVAHVLSESEPLEQLTQERQRRVEAALETCSDRSCLVDAFKWREEEVDLVSTVLVKEWRKSKALQQMIREELRPSGAYLSLDTLPDERLIRSAWELCVRGMNQVMSVYGNGEKANYPNIDSVTYDVHSQSYQQTIRMWAQEVLQTHRQDALFFEMPLDFTLSLLYLNHRDEAARYEPMEELENRAATDFIPSIAWEKYPYASIVVLGAGSEIPGVSLTPNGKLNLRLAVKQFAAGLAPLIIVSGGHVHPFRTPYCEAIEMKKELMEHYGIAEKQIVIEPHARHTTTNLRNASRLLFLYHTPTEKPSLVTTNFQHSEYVSSQAFRERCDAELGYQPGKLLNRISPGTVEFLPGIISFQQNPLEPLDP